MRAEYSMVVVSTVAFILLAQVGVGCRSVSANYQTSVVAPQEMNDASLQLDPIRHAELLEATGHFPDARRVLEVQFRATESLDILRLWLKFDQRRLHTIKNEWLGNTSDTTARLVARDDDCMHQAHAVAPEDDETTAYVSSLEDQRRFDYREAPTVFTPADTSFRKAWIERATRPLDSEDAYAILSSDPLTPLNVLLDRLIPSLPTAYKRMANAEESSPLPEPDVPKIADTLAAYDSLKDSMARLEALTKESLAGNQPVDILNERLAFHALLKQIRQATIQDRAAFVSYEVISPGLARAEQLVFLSVLKGKASPKMGVLPRPAKAELDKAAKFMAQVATEDTLRSAYEPVRDQFRKVLSMIKDTAKEAQFEDLKVLQTLTDTISMDKKLGPERWWQP